MTYLDGFVKPSVELLEDLPPQQQAVRAGVQVQPVRGLPVAFSAQHVRVLARQELRPKARVHASLGVSPYAA